MPVSFHDYLVVGISSRALFDLEQENEVFESQGLDAYRDYQLSHENDLLNPGAGFQLVKNLLHINEQLNRKVVEVIVMSKNSAETSLRLFHSIEHYGLDIGRLVMSGGQDLSNYLKAFDVDLFLSCDEADVSQAINKGFSAGLVYANNNHYDRSDDMIRIAFDADAVLFSADSEKIYKTQGLQAFIDNERENQDISLEKGPMARFLFALARLQALTKEHPCIRTAIITARDRYSGIRVIKTLRAWEIDVDEVFFMQGANKTEVLQSFGAQIFFDDQDLHAARASEVVPSARVPYKKGKEPI